MRASAPLLAPAVLLIVAGCAGDVRAPSLAPRAIERQAIEPPLPAPVEPEADADPALAGRLQPLLAQAEEGQRGFMAQHRRAEAAVASAARASPGDEAWIAAQQELTALDAARATVHEAAAAVDALRHEPAHAGSGSRAAIDAAAARIAALADAQAAALTALQARLR